MSRKFDIGEVAGLSYTRPPPCITVIFRVFGRILCHGNVVEGAVDEIDRKSVVNVRFIFRAGRFDIPAMTTSRI